MLNVKRKIGLLVLLCILFTGASISAGVPAAPKAKKGSTFTDVEKSEGRQLLLKVVNACGGLDTFKKVKNYIMTCKMDIPGQGVVSYKEIRVLPDKIAKYVTTQKGTQGFVCNGNEGWMISGQERDTMTQVQINRTIEELKRDQFYLLSHADDSSLNIGYRGREDFNGESLDKIEVVLNEKEHFSIYIHPETFFIAGMKTEIIGQRGPVTIKIVLSDYIPFGKIKLPSNIKQIIGGQKMTISDIVYTFDTKIGDSVFVKPKGL